jgi:parallel beta-helix repeat protein
MVVLLVFSGFVGLISFEVDKASALPPHNRIYIEGDSNFTLANGVTGGNGTPLDPYIIEGYDIDAPLNYGIAIRNTTKHFIIRDVYAHNSSIGIYFFNVTNGIIRDCNASDNWAGIYLANSDNITIINNDIHNNTKGISPSVSCKIIDNNITGNLQGIHQLGGKNVEIINNNISNNNDGIFITSSKNHNITGNNITGNDNYGIYMSLSFSSSSITYNNILDNGIGLYIISGYKVNITDNNISFNDRAFIAGVYNSNISRNTVISNNNTGIEIYSSQNNIFNNVVNSNNGIGIYLSYSDNNIISGNKISNNIQSGLEFDDSSYNVVMDNILGSNTDSGIAIRVSTYNTLNNNVMSSNGIVIYGEEKYQWNSHNIDITNTFNSKPVYYWVDKTGGTVPAGAGQVILVNCKYVNITNQDLSNGSIGIELAFSYNNKIDNNVIINNNNDGIYIIYSENNILINNTCTNNTSGIYLERSNYNDLYSNICNDNRGSGISLYRSRNNRLENNTCSLNAINGINLSYHSVDCSIKNNICNSNGKNGISLNFICTPKSFKNNINNFNKNSGIYIFQTHNSIFKNNSCNSNKLNGMDFNYADYNVLIYNNLNSNEQHGLYFQNCERNEIFGNIISYNLNSGIYLNVSDHSDFFNNSISLNEFGFYLAVSVDNFIYYNRFINNFVQAFETDKNYWSEAYIFPKGNYWSDYSGKDIYRGIAQDIPGRDGIGDTPYIINDDNSDYYPLMNSNYPIPPSAPRNLKLTSEDKYINLSWDPPAYDGNYPIRQYTILKTMKDFHYPFYFYLANVTYFNDSAVSYGETYSYKVNAMNLFGSGPSSSEINLTFISTPYSPKGVDIHIYPYALNLNWSPPASDRGSPITNYRIYRGTHPDNITFLTEIENVLFYNDTDVVDGVTYYYRISAKNVIGESQLSQEVYATAMGIPDKPMNLTVIFGNSDIGLNWTAPEFDGGSNITSYRIYRGTTAFYDPFLKEIDSKTEYRDNNCTRGVRYYYRVSAVNSKGESEKSNQVMGFLRGIPQAPQNLSAKTGDSFVNLTWSPPEFDGGDPLIRYYIHRGTTAGEEEAMDRVWSDILFYNDTGLTNGEIYYYKICASNDYGKGPFTESVRAIPEKTEMIIIENDAPNAQIVFKIYNATWKAPLTVNFNGSGFDTDGTIASYLWDFDDGNKSTEQNPVHTFTSPGTYHVKLTVMDNDGDLDVAMVTIVVEPEHDEKVDDTDKKIQDEEANRGAFWLLVAGGALSMFIAFFVLLFALLPALMKKKTPVEVRRTMKEVNVIRISMRTKSIETVSKELEEEELEE